MKTIIKIPLYVEVETQDGLDRKIISQAIQSHLIPEFFDFIKRYEPLSYFSSSAKRMTKEKLGENPRFKFISDSYLFRKEIPTLPTKKPWEL